MHNIVSLGVNYIVQDNEGLRPATVMVADGIKNTFSNDGREELLDEKRQQDCADYCE